MWSEDKTVSHLWPLALILSCTAWNAMMSAWLCTEILSGTPRTTTMRRGKQTCQRSLRLKATGKKWFRWVDFWPTQLWTNAHTVWRAFLSVAGELGSPRRYTWTLLQRCVCTDRARPADPGNENPTEGRRLGVFNAFYKHSVGCVSLDSPNIAFDICKIIWWKLLEQWEFWVYLACFALALSLFLFKN